MSNRTSSDDRVSGRHGGFSQNDSVPSQPESPQGQEGMQLPRQLAHLIGLLTSCLPAMGEAPLHYRVLQRSKNHALSEGNGSYNQRIHLSHDGQRDLQWWIRNVSTHLVRPIHTALILETDASMTGWGAFCQNTEKSTGNLWSTEEVAHHINWLELKGAFLALQCFVKDIHNSHILLLMDNQVTITYINKRGRQGPEPYAIWP